MPQVQIGGQPYDSYDTADEADSFLAGDVLRAPVWAAAADADTKARALVSASRLISILPWAVDPAPAPADADPPQAVKDATAMLAADILAKPKLMRGSSGNSNVRRAQAGSAAVEFFKPIEDKPPLADDIWAVLVGAGLVGPLSGDATEIPDAFGAWAGRHRDYCLDYRPLGGRWPGYDWPCVSGDYD